MLRRACLEPRRRARHERLWAFPRDSPVLRRTTRVLLSAGSCTRTFDALFGLLERVEDARHLVGHLLVRDLRLRVAALLVVGPAGLASIARSDALRVGLLLLPLFLITFGPLIGLITLRVLLILVLLRILVVRVLLVLLPVLLIGG